MNAKLIGYTTLIFVFFGLFTPFLFAGNTPVLNNGNKWRIAYYEGGPFSDYTDTMRTLVTGLIELGWITGGDPPDYREEMPKPYLDWLIKNSGPFLSFKPEDCYSANWDDQSRSKIRSELISKLENGDVDLVIAMGTWAGVDLANNKHTVPVLVLSTSDPIGAGIIDSAEKSGFKHVTARVDPNRYRRQIRMFHRIVGFNTLGIAFENTSDGRIYSAIDEVNRIAKERNFNIVTCEVIDTLSDIKKANQSCFECYRQLSERADAVYVTALTCADRETVEIANIFKASGTPSFSMTGSKWVKSGLLLSISSDSGYTELGKYNANKFGEILNGTVPESLNQTFEDPLDIAVNVKTAKTIKFNMPKSILKIATETYGE